VSVQFEVEDTVVRVWMAEVDRVTVDELRELLTDGLRRYELAPRPAPRRFTSSLIVDLGGVRFMDASGIRALLDADAAARGLGGRVVILGAHGPVRRVLEVTGVFERFQHPGERWAEG
jgi:anti-anti-sigma factor